MKLEHILILLLITLLVILLISVKRKTKRLKQQLSVQQTEAETFKNQILANIKKDIPHGEILLIKKFRSLFEDSTFAGVTIYSHLKFETAKGFKKVDYFIVSPKGLFVVESKGWKGITYIYSNYYDDIFKKTAYSSFGVGSSLNIKVFNAQQDADNIGKIHLSTYSNPVAQAREYSGFLAGILKVQSVRNIVVFSNGIDYDVLYNDEPIGIIAVDSFTSIMTDVNLKEFFISLPQPEYAIDVQGTIDFVDNNLHYKFKLDNNNYQQAPFISI
ncbi:MAG: NERD domain-containing protein [Clostridiales bacterium]|nr:NERD domain-containing protein [Clostridiales bacterium]